MNDVEQTMSHITNAELPLMIEQVTEDQKAAFYGILNAAREKSVTISKDSAPPWLDARSRFNIGGTGLNDALKSEIVKLCGEDPNNVTAVVDVPLQEVEHKDEVSKCGVIMENGDVRSPGHIWNAIVPSMRSWPMRIRLLAVKPEIDPVVAKKIGDRFRARFT